MQMDEKIDDNLIGNLSPEELAIIIGYLDSHLRAIFDKIKRDNKDKDDRDVAAMRRLMETLPEDR
jgi:hypothetical protein